ncbi:MULTISPECIES: Gfo/Idh/MocA family protein [Amycolatopsis]|uniref:Gfo/Idh/MocA family protein n=1 Tax=Amycolatopsis TaxID=1813 RepID=UPI000B8A8BD7|nr:MULTISPECIES: Gfo/Idh/MocA family oxidoreductase [Amycolatopsis]OXM72316.1 oxidoreductase [Amycolatopsis sp. KNN50.9b]
MRLGVVGLGVISKFYLAAARRRPDVTLAAVCDLRAAALEPHAGVVGTYRDHRAMLREAGLDGVVVTTPNDTHAPVCRDALAAGVAVCVEKPLAHRLADGRDLHRAARATGVPLFTAFHRRYNSAVTALRAGLSGGPAVSGLTVRYWERIEDHVGADRWYLDPRRCGGGCVADNGPNAFDLVRLLLGEVTVTGAGIRRDARGIDRAARVELRSRDGVPAVVELDWSYPGEVKDVEVRLRDGTVRRADMLAGHPGFKESLWHEYAGVLGAFTAAVAGGSRDDGGLAALELVEQTYHRANRYQEAP